MSSTLRDARRDAGMSQAALAGAAGVSRQAVGAIEAGRHRPSVDAAMALASAVGRSVEELFAAPPAAAVPALGCTAPDGAGVLAARVGGRIVHAPARDALAVEGWPRANAVMEAGRPQPLPGSDLDGLVLVGCDPALGLAAAMLPSVIALSGSTASALEAMADGRAHGALVHGPAGRLPEAPEDSLRLHLARWRVGVASRGPRPRAIADLARRGARVVQREDGASSQRAFVEAVAAVGASLPRGPVATGHLDAARRVAYGAPAGVTMEPAAIGLELAFAPLEEHVAEVWIDARWREHPAVAALGDLLRSGAFTKRLGLVGGYDLVGCGARSSS
jgi:DNA-binding XRE family transcriptional regulator